MTPLRKVLGLPDLIRFRRMIGLYAFFYGTLHFITYIWLDKFFDFSGHAEGHCQAAVHHRRLHGVRADDSAGADVHYRMDSPHGRQALATAAPAGLLQRRSRP